MTLWYVVHDGYTGPVPAGYTVLTPTSNEIQVAPSDTVLVSGSYSGPLEIGPSTDDEAAPLEVGVESTTNNIAISFSDPNFSLGPNGSFSPTVTIADGTTAPNVSIDGSDARGLTVDVGENATIGNISGSGADDTVTLQSGATAADVNTGSGNDAVTITDATVTGDVNTVYGDDTITLTGATIGGGVAGGYDSDVVTVTDSDIANQLSTADFAGSDLGGDTLTVTDTSIGQWIDMGGGNDVATVTGATSIGGDGVVAVNMGSGNDSLTLGPGITHSDNIRGGAGNDTVSIEPDTFNEQIALTTILNYEGYGITFGDPTPAPYDIGSDDDGLAQEFNWNGSHFTEWENAGVVCFARGTMIVTDRGEVAIEDLVEGDLVMTRDNGLQPIRWIGNRPLSAELLSQYDKLRPIRIRAGTLGKNTPKADLLVSPQHRVLVRSKIAQKMFGAPEVLVAARQLCQIDGIDIAEDVVETVYFHMLFDRHEVVFSNGAETESLFTGPEALRGVGPAAVEEIFAIFPQLRDRDYTPVAARPLASGRMGRKLAVRHAQNSKLLVK